MLGILSEAATHTILEREEGLGPNLENMMKTPPQHIVTAQMDTCFALSTI